MQQAWCRKKRIDGTKAVPRVRRYKYMKEKKVCAAKNDKEYVNVTDNSSHSFHAEIISPIISAGDVLGAVIMLSNNEKTQLSGTEQNLQKRLLILLEDIWKSNNKK